MLEVPYNCTQDDIKHAYRKQALKYHPKNNNGNPEAQRKFVEVNEAYNALSNHHKRENYDDILFREAPLTNTHDIFEEFMENRLFKFPK